jgi:hypothetical protein
MQAAELGNLRSNERDSLAYWHDRLHRQFVKLRASRAVDWPIFALEHALSADDLADMQSAIRVFTDRYLISRRMSNWLPFVVCASEFGYRYSGGEYWPTFTCAFPQWRGSERYRLREMFERFHRDFGGAKPSGEWADNYSIIVVTVLAVNLLGDGLRDALDPRVR